MLSVSIKNWDKWKSKLDTNILYQPHDPRYGIELDPHITICYGIHQHITGNDLEFQLPKIYDLDDIILGKLSLFTNDDFDVLKFNVYSQKLIDLNAHINSLFPVTNKYPQYIPHMTVAYLNKNSLTDLDLNVEPNISIIPKSYIYSYQNTKLILNARTN